MSRPVSLVKKTDENVCNVRYCPIKINVFLFPSQRYFLDASFGIKKYAPARKTPERRFKNCLQNACF